MKLHIHECMCTMYPVCILRVGYMYIDYYVYENTCTSYRVPWCVPRRVHCTVIYCNRTGDFIFKNRSIK